MSESFGSRRCISRVWDTNFRPQHTIMLKRLIGVGGLRRATRQRVMMDVTDNEHDDGAGETECSDDTRQVTRPEQGHPTPRRAQHMGSNNGPVLCLPPYP